MENTTNENKLILFADLQFDLSFIDENAQAVSYFAGTDDVAEMKNKHMRDVAMELEAVIKKYPHIEHGFQVVDPKQMEGQQNQETQPEVLEGEVVNN